MLIPEDLDLELDHYVERFEVARSANPQVDVAGFMPEVSHPRYAAIGCELLRVDMELSAAIGQVVLVESYRERFPQICQHPVHFKELTEEAQRVGKKSDHHSRSGFNGKSKPTQLPFPQAGQTICGFRLLAELGRGAFSCVYLATDASLSQRPVVLKFSSQFPGEAQLLSRLQHKNIVPIYSLHRWQEFHIICMPFLGALTLADLLKSEQPSQSKPLSGQALIDTLMTSASHTWKDGLPCSTVITVASTSEPNESGLSSQLQADVSRMSTTQLALWIVSELADGLAHAHARGILHRDIKPANVLLSDDGLPMLLDFNLAADSDPSKATEQIVGGTLRYMAPEQLQAYEKQTPSLDARTDIFSLGVVLYELLFHQPPFPDRTGNTREVLRQMLTDRMAGSTLSVNWQAGMTPAVVHILAKALACDVEERYATAVIFRDELRRQLDALPLRHTRNGSLRERVTKWNKRHPRISAFTITGTICGLLLAVAVTSLWIARTRVARLAAVNWLHTVEQTEAVARNLLACQNAPTSSIHAWLEESETVQSPAPAVQLGLLSPTEQVAARHSLAHLHFFRAQGELTLAARSSGNERRTYLQQALQELNHSQTYEVNEATSAWMQSIESVIAEQAGGAPIARVARPPAQLIDEQLQLAEATIDRQASNPWHWLSVGQLHLDAGQLASARSNFEISHQLDRHQPLPAFFLGVVEMQRKNFVEAEKWFTDAYQLDSGCPETLISRAASRVELKKYAEAIEDIEQLGDAINQFPRAWFIRERAELRLGKTSQARQSMQKGIELTPTDALGWNARGEAYLRTRPVQPEKALADFEKSIEVDPTLRNAYENAAHVLAEHLNRPQQAIDKLSAAVQIDPGYALAYSSRAVLYARTAQAELAIKDIDAALTIQREPIICYQAASALSLLAKTSEKNQADLADNRNQNNSVTKAVDLLKEALRKDPQLNKLMQHDPDLTILHDNPAFQQLLASARTLQ